MMGVELLLLGLAWLGFKHSNSLRRTGAVRWRHVTFARGVADVGTSRSASAVRFDEQRRSQK